MSAVAAAPAASAGAAAAAAAAPSGAAPAAAGSGAKKPVTYCPGSKVVLLQYADLVSGADVSDSITAAFGADGLGICAVQGIPKFGELRMQCLPLANKFANLSEAVKEKYVHEGSSFQFGWSHGKEKFAGAPDFLKGSYYNNPVHDRPFEDEAVIKAYPTFAHPNIWPDKDLPELAPAFKSLGGLCVDVGALLAKHCDAYVHARMPSYPKTHLYDVVTKSRVHKGRLLHYFPRFEADILKDEAKAKAAGAAPAASTAVTDSKSTPTEDELGSWCGWHNDHGSLTALVASMYIDSATGKVVANADPRAGLWIRSRKGELVQASFPADCMGFQMGETQQVHSGGLLQATPHCVLASHGKGACSGVSRETLAVFMEPEWGHHMKVPAGMGVEGVLAGSGVTSLPKGVPPLAKRWNPDQSQLFGAFTIQSIAAYINY